MKCSAIKQLARFGRDPCALLIVVLAGLGTAHILVRTATYGAAISTDSSYLLSTAMRWNPWPSYPMAGCIAIAHLPDYPIDRIYTGQWISEEDRTLWEAEFSASR